jgi:dehydrogenase/reductase SDR family member 7B
LRNNKKLNVQSQINQYFDQRVVWVTGASSGIGLALVDALHAMGALIIVSARNTDALMAIQKRLGATRVHVVALDLAHPDSIATGFEKALAWHNRIDIVFNNGGISQRSEALGTDLAVVRQIMEVNFFANVQITQWVLPGMIEQGFGHVVVTSSLMGKWGFYLRSAYGASKHALHGYYDSVRMEVEQKGVRITLLTPGFIATEISKHALVADGSLSGDMDANQSNGLSASECAARILKGVANGARELPVGGKELRGLWVKRFFPSLFEQILRRQKAR